jgi:hypothetical protein
MERRRAGGDGDGMFRTDDDGEIFFEGVEIRTRRRDPIGLEGFEDVFDFRGPDVRRGEVDTGKRHWFIKVQRCKSEQSSCAKVQKWMQILLSES